MSLARKETMSSLQIAEISGKPHNDVLKAIRAMEPAWEKINGGNFSLIKYTDQSERGLRMERLDRSETVALFLSENQK